MTVSTSNHLRVSQSDQWIKDLSFKCLHVEFKISGDVGQWNKAKKGPNRISLWRLPPPLLTLHTTCGGGIENLLSVYCSLSLSLRVRQGSRCKNIFNLKSSFWCFSHCFRRSVWDCFYFSFFSIPQPPTPAGFATITAWSRRGCDHSRPQHCFLFPTEENKTHVALLDFCNPKKCKYGSSAV